jgi:hypothetical protein
MANAPEVLEQEVAPTLSVSAANFDTQVATAKRFPRSIARFMQHAQEMATLTPEIAASCIYAIPRDNKMIEGPSARLAEIVAHAWGNLRIQASASEADDRFIVGRGEAWDVETNVAIGYEVRRRITGRNKQTFSDDMIAVTGNAAASIALRNAVFKAVPSSFWKPIYAKCRQVVAGKAETFQVRRDEMLKAFGVAGVTKEQVCGLLGVRGVLDITLEHMVTLTGVLNALKEGEATIEDTFPAAPIKTAERKSEQAAKETPAPASSQAPESQKTDVVDKASQQPTEEEARSGRETPSAASGTVGGPSTTAAPLENVGTIETITEHGQSIVVVLNTGFKCSTKDEAKKQSARNLKEQKRIVELVTTQAGDPTKFMPRLDEMIPMAAAE